uniref:Uncharacterized protein n=1 Tax=Cucumis melo TaxID=3656 RepID=A0A9I9EIL4_CUCME
LKKTGQLVFTRNQEVSGRNHEPKTTKNQLNCRDKLKRSCAYDSGSGSVSRVIGVYARGIRFIYLQMIDEIFINYTTEILSMRLEITMCTLVSLGLLVKLCCVLRFKDHVGKKQTLIIVVVPCRTTTSKAKFGATSVLNRICRVAS